MTMPNGGELIARIATMLLVPVCLGDDRSWQWTLPAGPMSPWWRGSTCAALITVRVQLAIVYGEAAVSKLLVPEWRDGTALYAVSYDPDSGLSAPLQQIASPFLARYPLLATLTWAVIGAELTIAVGILGPRATRRAALALVVVLHAAIVVALGLFSFGIIMIATAAIACAWRPSPQRLRTTRPADVVIARSAGSRLPRPSLDPAGGGGR
jgi:antimicrobial peptide system SdpB family protein